MFMQCLPWSIQMAGVTLPAGVLTKPCCTSGIGGFVLGKHMGAMRSVMPASSVCKNSHNRRGFVLQRRVWCCWKQLNLVLGLWGLHGKSPMEIFRSTSKEPGLGWRAGAGGCWRVLKGAASHSGAQLQLLAGTVLLPASSGTSHSCPEGEQRSRWRFPLDQSARATCVIAVGLPDPAQRRVVG